MSWLIALLPWGKDTGYYIPQVKEGGLELEFLGPYDAQEADRRYMGSQIATQALQDFGLSSKSVTHGPVFARQRPVSIRLRN